MTRQLSKTLGRLNSGTLTSVLKGTYGGGARRLNDGGGLYLLPGPNGGGSWVLRYQRDSKSVEAGLGPLSRVTAAQARAERAKLLTADSPLQARRAERSAARDLQTTFRDAAEPVIAHYEAGPYHPSTKQRWRSISEKYIFPKIGHLAVDDIGRAEVLAILRPLWSANRPTAERARAIIEAVIEEAKVQRQSDEERANPAGKSIKHHLKRYALTVMPANHPALSWRQVPALVARLNTPASDRYHKNTKPSVSALALMMVILSGVRAGEAIGARWDEFDDAAWHIPAERMKGKPGLRRKHDVPISDGMRLVLNTLRPVKGASPLVFPSYASGRPITSGAMWKLLKEYGYSAASVHGFRSSFRDFGRDNGFDHQVCEAALAHAVGGVAGRYARSDLFDQRVPLMKAWSAHCLSALATQRHLSVIAS
jgi:integrase